MNVIIHLISIQNMLMISFFYFNFFLLIFKKCFPRDYRYSIHFIRDQFLVLLLVLLLLGFFFYFMIILYYAQRLLCTKEYNEKNGRKKTSYAQNTVHFRPSSIIYINVLQRKGNVEEKKRVEI